MQKTNLPNNVWVICEGDFQHPHKHHTASFDTETQTLLNGVVATDEALKQHTLNCQTDAELKSSLSCNVWSWQLYDEINGFFMTNSFDEFLAYIARASYKSIWCYNAKFDFSQIDYKILTDPKWSVNEGGRKGKAQAWTYSSLHNGMGARYSYRLWLPRKNANRTMHTHAVSFYDMANFYQLGLANLLKELNVTDAQGRPIRKLEMDYQGVNTADPTVDEIAYCKVDVEGLYYAVKAYDQNIATLSQGECHIYGAKVDCMTAGGFAKRELLRSLYPTVDAYKDRLKQYQKEHPISIEQDKYVRYRKLYRGGLCVLNSRYADKMVIGQTMYRYDVNSEYPYAMSMIDDAVGEPLKLTFEQFCAYDDLDQYHVIFEVNHMLGTLKQGYVPIFVENGKACEFILIEDNRMFYDFELYELCKWYDLTYEVVAVFLIRRGDKIYKPFVDNYYSLKAHYKKTGEKGLCLATKLILNSSSGKLAERIERVKGEYKINEQTGCVHFTDVVLKDDDKARMSIYVGALVTAYARTYLMSNIRQTYGEQMSEKFIYCDTDSIHGLLPMDNDPVNLGGFKLEAKCSAFKYLAPKSYADITCCDLYHCCLYPADVELHTKGVNVRSVRNEMQALCIRDIDERFGVGKQYWTLGAYNVKGGKVLLPIRKYIVTPDVYDSLHMSQGFLFEV